MVGCGTSAEEVRPLKDRLSPRSCAPAPVSHTATLPIGEPTVAYLAGTPPSPDPPRPRAVAPCGAGAALGSSTRPGSPNSPPTTSSAPPRPIVTCVRASTSSPRSRPVCAVRRSPPAPPGTRTSTSHQHRRHPDPHRTGSGPAVMATRRNAAVSCHRLDGATKIASAPSSIASTGARIPRRVSSRSRSVQDSVHSR